MAHFHAYFRYSDVLILRSAVPAGRGVCGEGASHNFFIIITGSNEPIVTRGVTRAQSKTRQIPLPAPFPFIPPSLSPSLPSSLPLLPFPFPSPFPLFPYSLSLCSILSPVISLSSRHSSLNSPLPPSFLPFPSLPSLRRRATGCAEGGL